MAPTFDTRASLAPVKEGKPRNPNGVEHVRASSGALGQPDRLGAAEHSDEQELCVQYWTTGDIASADRRSALATSANSLPVGLRASGIEIDHGIY